MANTVSSIDYANTFGDWVVTTNALVRENNDFAANNYTKPTGTLYLSEPTLGLQVSANAIVAGQLQVTGIGSSAYVQNNLRVDTQAYFTNTTLGLVNSGQANIGGLLLATGSGTGLIVANTANVGAQLNVTGATRLGNTLTVAGATQINNTLTATGNTHIVDTFHVDGTTYINDDTNVTGNVNVLTSVNVTNDVNASRTNTVYNTHTGTLDVTNGIVANNITANTRITSHTSNTGTLTVSDTTYTDILVANSTIDVPTANISSVLNGNNATGYFSSLHTTGDLVVGGDFVIEGTTVYSTNTFTLSAGSSTADLYSYIDVNRGSTGANASIRWNETGKYWDILDVNTGGSYSKVLTANLISNSVTSTSTATVASSNAANILNNTIVTANTSMKSYVDGANTSMKSYVDTANTSMKSYVDNITTTQVAPAFTRANTMSNTFIGTTGSVTPTNSIISFTSNNGVTIVATSANNLAVSTSQDLRTSASPTFAGMTLTAPLGQAYGGTGATSQSGALTALLPTGTTAGYVLTTGGPGNFYWAAAAGGGGGVTPGTSINSTRLSYTANGAAGLAGNTFTTPSFTTSTQVRAYMDGVRQFESEYTLNQGANTITFSTTPASGSAILVEVDGYYVNPYYANNITFTAPFGDIVSSANTIQLAIQDLETRKAPLASPAFTGIATSTTVSANASNTAVATTAFVKNVLNSGNTFTINAATVTNGVVTTGSYADPSWITSLANTKISGVLTGSQLASTAVTTGTYGGASQMAVFTVDQQGRITAASNVTASIANTQITGTFTATNLTGTPNISVGTITASGAITSTGDITAFYSSDAKLKNIIGVIPNALAKVSSIDGVTYTWNELAVDKDQTVPEAGVIAQQIQSVLPEIVTEREDGYLAVRYERLVPLLIEAIKELKNEVDVLKGKLNDN